jgi:hypothetical protein
LHLPRRLFQAPARFAVTNGGDVGKVGKKKGKHGNIDKSSSKKSKNSKKPAQEGGKGGNAIHIPRAGHAFVCTRFFFG